MPEMSDCSTSKPIDQTKRMKKAIALLIGGAILALGPVWGAIGTIIGMVGAFHTLSQKMGMGKADALAADISFSLYTTLAGFIVCPVGIVLIVLAVRRLNKLKSQVECKNKLSESDCVL